MRSESKAAFSGLRVVELAQGIPGPYAARFLADQGADVIKIEPPQGDTYRDDPGFQALNRNKRSVVSDDPEQLCAQLAPGADVLVVPSKDHADRLRSCAPNAVVVSFPVWGAGVQPLGSAAAVPAVTGIGWNQISYSEGPVDLVFPVAAYGAGMLGAVAIAAGLYARLTGNTAPTYEVSEVAGAGAMQVGDFNAEVLGPERDGSSPLGSTGRAPAYRLFRCADGEWMFVACGTTAFYEAMLRAIERTDLLGDPRLPTPPWGLLDLEPLALITPELEAAFAGRTREQWMEILAAHDVPCQPVWSRQDFMASPLAIDNGLDAHVQHSELGDVRVPPQPFRLSECPAVELAAAPLLGEHTEEILRELSQQPLAPPEPASQAGRAGADSTSANRASSNRAGATQNPPLSGLSALDLSSFIAGPVITRYLAMLGADVIKIEPPQGEPFRVLGPFFNGWNQAKRSITLDLKAAPDRDIFHRLVGNSDVLVENFRPGVAARLGCSEADLRAIRPDLITVQSPGYGTHEPMADVPAFDPLLQALGGIMDAQGGDTEPVFLTVPVHDVITPLIATFGVIAALYHRASSGSGQTIHTSLVRTTSAAQAAELVDYEGRPPTRRGGFDYRGPANGAHYEQTPQGWVWQEEQPQERQPVPVCTVGFVGSQPALEAGLVAEYPDTEWGPIAQIGQLITGAGPHPTIGPQLDEHRAEILAELEES